MWKGLVPVWSGISDVKTKRYSSSTVVGRHSKYSVSIYSYTDFNLLVFITVKFIQPSYVFGSVGFSRTFRSLEKCFQSCQR